MAQVAFGAHPVPATASRIPPVVLERLGVKVLNRYGLLLECCQCHARWTPRLPEGLQLPPGYWRCPNRCNW